jgi:hypothetical protein
MPTLATDLGRVTMRIALASLLVALTAACSQGAHEPQPGGGGEGEPNFVFLRWAGGLARMDSRTGELWTTPTNGDGGWQARGGPPGLAGEPAAPGRFGIRRIAPQRNAMRLGQQHSEPVLLRIDQALGRAWILESVDATSWLELRAPDAPPATPAPSAPPVETADPATPPAAPAATGDVSDTWDEKPYPILTGEQLGASPEDQAKTIQTLREARQKRDMPAKIRVWSVAQLAEIEPDLAVPELLAVLDEGEPLLMAQAIQSLGKIGRPSTIPRIVALKEHPDARVRAAASAVVVQVQ